MAPEQPTSGPPTTPAATRGRRWAAGVLGWPARPPSAARRAAAGAVAAMVGLATAALAALVLPGGQSPLVSVADQVVSLAPSTPREATIALLGTADKPFILAAVAAVTVALAALLGLLSRRDRRPLAAGGAILLAVGVAATAASAPSAVAAGLVGMVLSALAAAWSVGRLTRPPAAGLRPAGRAIPAGRPPASWAEREMSRRQFTLLAAGMAVLAVAGQGLASLVGSVPSSAVERFRAATRLTRAAHPLPPPPAADSFRIAGLTPLVTPNAGFYRVDTAFVPPSVDPVSWRLSLDGMVDRPLTFRYEDLMAMPQEEAYITLCCVSDPVGGSLIGNALWQGVRLARLLALAGVRHGADQLVGRSVDGFTAGFPTALALDGRAALVALGMNGEPLPIVHGFPARLIVPGLYGYVCATKWLTEIRLTTLSSFTAYWEQRGWGPPAPVATESRIDVPRDGAALSPGEVTVAGVAWAQHRGIRGVQVRVDGGPWRAAELAGELSIDTWRQWRYRWTATRGRHTLAVRATDAGGRVQTARTVPPFPDGATGYPSVRVTVG